MLGSDRVVLDLDEIAHGPNFASALTERVKESDAVVMIIGKNWHTKTLADPNDRVRIEIEAALNRKIQITLVLVDGASMPQPGDLPESLKALTHMRPIDLSSEHFDADMKRLEEALRDPLSVAQNSPCLIRRRLRQRSSGTAWSGRRQVVSRQNQRRRKKNPLTRKGRRGSPRRRRARARSSRKRRREGVRRRSPQGRKPRRRSPRRKGRRRGSRQT